MITYLDVELGVIERKGHDTFLARNVGGGAWIATKRRESTRPTFAREISTIEKRHGHTEFEQRNEKIQTSSWTWPRIRMNI